MSLLDPQAVRRGLFRLACRRPDIFGAIDHGFVLNPPRSEADVGAFETKYGIRLPADYRHFITQIGDGGAGPFYGVFPLSCWDGAGADLDRWEEGDGCIGTLAEPFPLVNAWNDLTGLPADELQENDEAEYERQYEAFEQRYYDASRMNGAIPICTLGCALRIWLIVTGPEAGYLWSDDRADHGGLAPITLKNGIRATFADWYREWLDEALQSTEPAAWEEPSRGARQGE